MSGRFVAPMMKTVFFADMPSISVNSWFSTLSAAPPASPELPPLCKRNRPTAQIPVSHLGYTIQGFGFNLSGNGVKLIKEENARGRLTGLIKDLADVGLTLAKPHGEQFRALHTNKVGLALIRYGFRQQRFPAARRPIEEHPLRWRHAKFLELLWVLHRILNRLYTQTDSALRIRNYSGTPPTLIDFRRIYLLKLPLYILQATNILPRDIRHFHHLFLFLFDQ